MQFFWYSNLLELFFLWQWSYLLSEMRSNSWWTTRREICLNSSNFFFSFSALAFAAISSSRCFDEAFSFFTSGGALTGCCCATLFENNTVWHTQQKKIFLSMCRRSIVEGKQLDAHKQARQIPKEPQKGDEQTLYWAKKLRNWQPKSSGPMVYIRSYGIHYLYQ